ncbi:hypothetical protein [Anaerotignum sp.]|uniref:hypothetical protein n=1 Tax=Anaerotignum sp. TaxID=2039241 RepID=UPI0028A1660A|nr:hypothetical protein [Anaerotignum sp.]
MLEAINNKNLKLMDILSMAMKLFIGNFPMVMVVVAFLFFPISILNAMIMERLNIGVQLLDSFNTSGAILDNMPAFQEVALNFFRNYFLLIAMYLFLEPIGVISVAKIAKKSVCGETIRMSEIIGEAMNCLWSVIITSVPFFILVFVASMLFIVPGVYLGIIWTFYVYAIGLRQKRGWKALEYSAKLTKGKFWQTVLVILTISLITFGWDWIFGTVKIILPRHIGTDILSYTLSYIVACFSSMAMTVLFMNREAVLLGEKQVKGYSVESTIDEEKK